MPVTYWYIFNKFASSGLWGDFLLQGLPHPAGYKKYLPEHNEQNGCIVLNLLNESQ